MLPAHSSRDRPFPPPPGPRHALRPARLIQGVSGLRVARIDEVLNALQTVVGADPLRNKLLAEQEQLLLERRLMLELGLREQQRRLKHNVPQPNPHQLQLQNAPRNNGSSHDHGQDSLQL